MTFLSTQNFDENGEIHAMKNLTREFKNFKHDSDENKLSGQIELNEETEAFTREDATPFASVEEAERWVLKERNVFSRMSSPPINHVRPECRAAHRITMAMSNVATHAARGFGNTVIYHPDLADTIEEAKTATKLIKDLSDTDNNGPEMAMCSPYFKDADAIDWIEHPDAPHDKVLVLYRGNGETDQPLIYVDGEGLILNSVQSAVAGYGKFTKVT